MKNKHLSSTAAFSLLLLNTFCTQSRADITVDSVATLVAAVNNTQSGGDRTILIADGTYLLNGSYLRLAVSDVTVRSASGNREAVILDGGYVTTEIFQVVASNALIADITLKRAQDHPIHVMGGGSGNVVNTIISNVHIIDPGEQAIKINQANGYFANSGIIRNSLIELTDSGRSFVENDTGNGYPCYTGGVDGHAADGWMVRDNEIRGFWCSTGLSEHGIHFWDNSANTLVERNLITDCDRGIGFGLGTSPHHNGIIRNNMIQHGATHGYSDVGIGLETADNVQIFNNTIFQEHSYPNAIEYRYAASNNLEIINNLTNRAITSRDGGDTVFLSNNLSTAEASWFVDAAAGDLHLQGIRAGVSDTGYTIPTLTDDFDQDARPQNSAYDIGADEYVPPAQPVKAITPITSMLLLNPGS